MDPNTRKTDVGLGRRAAAIATVAAVVLTAGGLLASQPLTARASGYDWLQFDGNAQHSGNNTMETAITPANVGTLTRLFQVTLPAVADGPPAYLSGVATANGTQDLLFLTTKDGQILARDAHTGTQLWGHQNGPGSCKINNGSSPCYTTSEPAVDPNRQFVYSYGLDGKAHKYAVGDGTEVMTGGWPETTTLKGYTEKGSSDLTVATTGSGASATPYLYVTHGGYPGDAGDYQGHVTSINLNTGSQTVFNADCSNLTTHLTTQSGNDCSNVQNAIWARAGVTYDAQTNRIYMSTGNGKFDPAHYTWGDTLFALNPDGTGQNGNPLLTYTPTDYQNLQNADADLGSTAPVILPPPAGSNVSHLGLQSDKAAKLRLLNLDTLSGGTGNTGGEIAITGVPQGGEVLTQPAVWINPADGSTWTFVANDQGLSALKVTLSSGGQPSLSTMWRNSSGGTSPIIANNVLYYVGGGGLRALDPTTGNQLWADTSITRVHWESPIVANGVLYTTDDSGKLTAYTLPASATSTATSTAVMATSTPTTASSPTSTRTTAPSATATGTTAPSATATTTPVPATATPTTVSSATATRTAASSATATRTAASSATATVNTTPTSTATGATTPSATTTSTVSSSATATATASASVTTTPTTSTATATTAPSATATNTSTATATNTSTATATNTSTATASSTNTATATIAAPSPTSYPTIVMPSATATARPTLGLVVRVHPLVVVRDHFLSVRVYTRPGARIAVTLELPVTIRRVIAHTAAKSGVRHPVPAGHASAQPRHHASSSQPRQSSSRGYVVTHNGVANAHGFYVTYFYVTYKNARPALGLVTVTAHTRGASATRHVYIVVLPPRRIARSG